jgi:hypothetical protein
MAPEQISTPPFDPTAADGRSKSISPSVIRARVEIRRRQIFDGMALPESGLQTFLKLESAEVRTDTYSHDLSLDTVEVWFRRETQTRRDQQNPLAARRD